MISAYFDSNDIYYKHFEVYIYKKRNRSLTMSSDTCGGGSPAQGSNEKGSSTSSVDKQKEKARVSRTSLILWHAHQNDPVAVRKLLEEDRSLVQARDYDNRTPLHVASLHGWIDVAKCLIDYGADVNAQDRWKNTVLLKTFRFFVSFYLFLRFFLFPWSFFFFFSGFNLKVSFRDNCSL